MRTKAQHACRYAKLPGLLRDFREEAGHPQSWVYNCETGNRRVDLAEFCDWCVACEVEPATALRRFMKK